jgi:hypothetical protein
MLEYEKGDGAVRVYSREAAVGASVVALASGLIVEVSHQSHRVV